MKKLFSLVLALVLVFGLCASAVAAPFYLESAGVTVEVPDGYTAKDASDEANAVLGITDDADSTVAYTCTVTYIEELEGKDLSDVTEEEAEQIGQGVAAAIENPTVGPAEVNGMNVLVITAGDGTQLHYMTILNGWMLDVACAKNDGAEISDAQIATTAQLLTGIKLDTDSEEAVEAEAGEEEAAEEEAA